MKSKLFPIILGLSVFLIISCNNDATDSQASLPSNLPESKGTNEFTGKTFQNQNTTFEFNKNTVSQSSNSKISENTRAAEQNNKIQDFYYSYDSENKTLYFQLQQVWGTGIALDYETQLSKAKNQYKQAIVAVKAAIQTMSYAPNTDLNTKIKNQVTSSANEWINSQEALLSEYLEKKYNSVIHFEYELSDTKLVLSEKFNNDLADASSKFVYEGDYSVTLNDYDHLIPFKVQKDNSVYVGIPKFDNPKATSGTVEVILYPYPGDIYDASTLATIVTKVSAIPTDVETLTQIGIELATSDTSATLKAFIDSKIGQQMLKGTYEIKDNNITLKFTQVPAIISDIVKNGNSIDLTHTPLLGAEFNIVE